MPEQKTLLIMALRSLFVGSQFVASDEAAEVPETEARELIHNGWAVESQRAGACRCCRSGFEKAARRNAADEARCFGCRPFPRGTGGGGGQAQGGV